MRAKTEETDRSGALSKIKDIVTAGKLSAMRAKAKWAWSKQKEESVEDTLTKQLKSDSAWHAEEERKRFSKLEFRHSSNLPGTHFDQYDREAMEKWLGAVDPMAVEGRTTREMRKIAEFNLSEPKVYALPGPVDSDADSVIRGQLKLTTGEHKKPSTDAPEIEIIVDMVPPPLPAITLLPAEVAAEAESDPLIEQAASVIQSINTVVRTP